MKRPRWTLEERFPTPLARAKADEAIEPLGVHEPMHVFIDTWVAAYRAAGGKESSRK